MKKLLYVILALFSLNTSYLEAATGKVLGFFGEQSLSRGCLSKIVVTGVPFIRTISSVPHEIDKKTVRILSIDGGGIRGILPTLVLERLELKMGSLSSPGTKKKIGEVFDVIAGTSTGGIIALALSVPDKRNENEENKVPRYSAKDIKELYIKEGQHIFSGFGWLRKVCTLYGLFGPKYSTNGFKKILLNYFGNDKLSEAVTNVLVTGHNLMPNTVRKHGDVLFESLEARRRSSSDFLMRDVARATGSAPSYFKAATIKSVQEDSPNLEVIDGAIFCNNPSLVALKKARAYYPNATDFLLVSLGTGVSDQLVLDFYGARKGGMLKWARTFPSLMLQNASSQVHRELSDIIPDDNYRRIQFFLPKENVRLDDASSKNIKDLTMLGESQLEDFDKFLEEIARRLIAES